MKRTRARYAALALATIAIGLLVHSRGNMLAGAARDIIGDALWAAMMVWWVSVIAPTATAVARGAAAYAICMVVELSQLMHTPALDALRASPLGHLVLGSGFDPRDFAAYAAGVVFALLIDRMLTRRATFVG